MEKLNDRKNEFVQIYSYALAKNDIQSQQKKVANNQKRKEKEGNNPYLL